MQPENNGTDWRQPSPQSSQSPYAAEVPEGVNEPAATPGSDESLSSYGAQGVKPKHSLETKGGNNNTLPMSEPIHWQANEYIQRDKGAVWPIAFGLVFLAIMAVSIFLIKSLTFNILVPVMAISLLVYVYRSPRSLQYTLSHQGLHIDDVLYPFADFKSFGVIQDYDNYSIMLVPIKRFKLALTVYFPEEVGEVLVDTLGARLPMQDLKLDVVDRLIRKLRI